MDWDSTIDLKLEGKSALITAASCIDKGRYGLGYACAYQLAKHGANVAIVSHNEENTKRAADYIRKEHNVEVMPITADITDPGAIYGIHQAACKLGSIDILVISTPHPPIVSESEVTPYHRQQGEKLCLSPSRNISEQFLGEMMDRKSGSIIFIGSPYGIWPNKESVVQSEVKAQLNRLALYYSNEVKEYGISVNVVCPGFYLTELVRGLAAEQAKKDRTSPELVLKSWKAYSPDNKIGDPMGLGEYVSRLASPLNEITRKAVLLNWKTDGQFHEERSEFLPGAVLIDLKHVVDNSKPKI